MAKHKAKSPKAKSAIPSIPLNPEEMFKNALSFHYSADVLNHVMAARSLLRRLQPQEQVTYPTMQPMVVNSAFCIELYFKCIYAIENSGKMFRSHSLFDLFHKLGSDIQKHITEIWESQSKETHQLLQTAAAKKFGSEYRYLMCTSPSGMMVMMDTQASPNVNTRLNDVLRNADEAFEKWRYAFEGEVTNFEFAGLATAIQMAILEIKPAWNSLVVAIGSQPTFQVH